MLGLTTYEEALRSLGRWLDVAAAPPAPGPEAAAGLHSPLTPMGQLLVTEDRQRAVVDVVSGVLTRAIDAAELEALVLASRARRGTAEARGGALADLLRALGFSLDQLHARTARIALAGDTLLVEYIAGDSDSPRRVAYSGSDLEGLRQMATARRLAGVPWRVTILSDEPAADDLREILAAECALEERPTAYASAVAGAKDLPHLVLVRATAGPAESVLQVIAHLRGSHGSHVPTLLLLGERAGISLEGARHSGADDALPEHTSPADIRQRVRTLLLRGARPPEGAHRQHTLDSRWRVAEASVACVQLHGFSVLAGLFAEDPLALLHFMNHRFEEWTRLVAAHGGTIEQYMDGGVLASFGARGDMRDHRAQAVAAALDLAASGRGQSPGFRFDVTVGLATGKVIADTSHAPGHLGPGVLGNPINEAERLARRGAAGQVLVKRETLDPPWSGAHGMKGRSPVLREVDGTEVYQL